MTYLPDYGLAMKQEGIQESCFLDFRTDHVSSVGPNLFTTMVVYPWDGKDHSLSLDFDGEQLLRILAHAPYATAARVREWMLAVKSHSTIEVPEKLCFACKAVLGKEQGNSMERYVPLVVEEITDSQAT